MNVSLIDIKELLPQQEPFVMVGRLDYFDMERTVTCTEVKEDNIFVEDGHMQEAGIIENIAQTCAARIGYINRYILKQKVQIGFIGAIRHLQIFILPKVGDILMTTVVTREEVFGMTLVSASVSVGGKLIASAEMKISVKEQE